MNPQMAAQAWQRLLDARIAQGEQPPASATAGPWYIAAMTGAAAWLAAIFLTFFVGVMLEDVLDERAGALIVGIVLTAACVIVLRRFAGRLFVSQLALAFSLAGQAMVCFGLLVDEGWRTPLAWLVFAAFELALVVLVEQSAHRVLAVLAAAFSLRMAMFTVGVETLFLPLLLAGFVFAQTRVLAGDRRFMVWRTVAIGLALGILATLVGDAALADIIEPRSRASEFASLLPIAKRLLLAAVCAVAAAVAARDAGADLRSPTVIVAMLLAAAVALAAYPIPGVAAAVVVLLMAFAASQPALIGLAFVMLVAAFAHYYYKLDATLLVKSGALGGVGVILLVARAALGRLIAEPEMRHA